MNIRPRPQTTFLLQAPWEELYKINEHWLSQLSFYQNEIQFFEKLIEQNFMIMLKEDEVKIAKNLIKKLLDIKNENNELIKNIHENQAHISTWVKEKQIQKHLDFRKEHSALEDKIVHFNEKYQAYKQELFDEIEKLKIHERQIHLLK